MNIRTIVSASLLTALLLVLLPGCTTTGPDVVDPKVNERTETALFAIQEGTNGEMLRYSEQNGVVSAQEYQKANGVALGRPIDAIYEAYDSLFLHDRTSGTITVLDLQTRKKVGELTGFFADIGEGLCGMAFSNRAQAWVISYGSPNLYPVDAYNLSVLAPIPLPGNPTAIGTSGTRIFVGMKMADGSGAIAVLSSNSGTYAIEQTIPVPTPIIFITGTANGAQAFALSAGAPGLDTSLIDDDIHPRIYTLRTAQPAKILLEAELPYVPTMFRWIGTSPTFAAPINGDFLYLAVPDYLYRVDMQSLGVENWLPGSFNPIGTDRYTGLLYTNDAGTRVVHRTPPVGDLLPDITLPQDIRAIHFVSTNRLR